MDFYLLDCERKRKEAEFEVGGKGTLKMQTARLSPSTSPALERQGWDTRLELKGW
jgi:hypothetical protein